MLHEVKKGLFKHERLIAGLVEIVGQKEGEHKTARSYAVWVIIADGDEKAGLFHFPGLMPRISSILGDAILSGHLRG